jgi:hypothetical protein
MSKLIMPAAVFSLWLVAGCVESRVETKPLEPALTPASYDKMKNAAQSGGKPLELAGYYFLTEVCRSHSLILLPKGHYSLTWHGCQGLYGTAVGTWRLAGCELFLDPAEEEGMWKDRPVRHLDILLYEGIHILVWDADKEAFLRDGPGMRTCFAPARSFPW